MVDTAVIEAIADRVAEKIAPCFYQVEPRWNAKQVAEFLNCTQKQIYNLTNDRLHPLPHYKIGKMVRFEPHEVREWAARFRLA